MSPCAHHPWEDAPVVPSAWRSLPRRQQATGRVDYPGEGRVASKTGRLKRNAWPSSVNPSPLSAYLADRPVLWYKRLRRERDSEGRAWTALRRRSRARVGEKAWVLRWSLYLPTRSQ